MRLTFRIKLIASITTLIAVLLASSALFFLNDKQSNLKREIFNDVVQFTALTAPKVSQSYELYWQENGFIYFKSVVAGLYANKSSVSDLRLTAYDGQLFYDSQTEKDQMYQGDKRMIVDDMTLKQVQAFYPSVVTKDGYLVFLKPADATQDKYGEYLYVDENEQVIQGFSPDTEILYAVQPVDGRYALINYVDYSHMYELLASARNNILLLALFGVILSIFLAVLLAYNFSDAIYKLTRGAYEIAQGNFSYTVDVRTGDELEVLGSAFNKMALDLKDSTQALVYKEKTAHELELAAKIQQSILPKEIPKLNGIDLAAAVLPAEEIGGDLYDFVPIDDDNMLMYLGDVTGHGVSSGIVVSIANALFYAFKDRKDLKEILVEVNKIVKLKTTATMFLTLCLLKWNISSQKLSFVSAGHEQPIHYSAKDGKVTLLPSGGIALGMVENIGEKLEEVEVKMESGDVVVIYSDGIPEAWRNERENYGMARLKRIVSDAGNLEKALSVKNTILADVKEYAAGYKQMDDMTVLVIKKL